MCHWCTCQVERSHLGQTASLSRYCATTSIHLPASFTASTLSPVSRRRIVIESSCTWPPFCSRFFAIRLQKRQVLLLTHLNCIHTEECRAPTVAPFALGLTICIMRFERTRTGSSFAKTLPAADAAAQAKEAVVLWGDRGPVLRGRRSSRVPAATGRRRRRPRPRRAPASAHPHSPRPQLRPRGPSTRRSHCRIHHRVADHHGHPPLVAQAADRHSAGHYHGDVPEQVVRRQKSVPDYEV